MVVKQKLLLGITGSIAAYKTPELVRQLLDAGFEVKVVLTESAKAFVTPLTLEAVSKHPVSTVLLEPKMEHIELAKWADIILIAPATANILAKLAHGFADELLSAICLVSQASVLIAPAMNQAMWQHAATQENVACLKKRGTHFLGPDVGLQACGDNGPGRMLEPAAIVEQLSLCVSQPLLAGQQILITAGATREAIDPVRFISNRSSGKMGYALAEAATALGAEVTLISGPTLLNMPSCKKFIAVTTAAEMLAQVEAEVADQAIFISAAAVSDYQVEHAADQKMKRNDKTLSLTLIPTIDILARVCQSQPRLFTVGFAAETENLVENAKSKLLRKGVDMIVANDVSRDDIGFDGDANEVTVFTRDKAIHLEKASKLRIVEQVLEIVADLIIT